MDVKDYVDYFHIASLIILIIGFSILLSSGLQNSQHSKTDSIYNASAEFVINDVKFVVSDEIGQGNYGRYMEKQDTIYIKSGRSLHKMKDTCEHEVLHYRGLDAKESTDHEYIYRNQGNVNSDMCIRFLYELGKAAEG